MKKNPKICASQSHNVVKRDAGVKKGKLLCFKCIFDRIKANLAETQLKKHQRKCQKDAFFCKKFQESMGKYARSALKHPQHLILKKDTKN